MNKEDAEIESNKKIGEFMCMFSYLSFRVLQTIVFLANNRRCAKRSLEDQFNALALAPKRPGNRKTLEEVKLINKNHPEYSLEYIIFSHFGEFSLIVNCLQGQLNSLELPSKENEKWGEALSKIRNIVTFRNDLVHSGLITQPRNISLLRYKLNRNGVLTKKDINGTMDDEIGKMKIAANELTKIVDHLIKTY